MTIVEKVKRLLAAEGSMTLREIYERLPENTPASIRGNINRYLEKAEKPEFARIGKGLYAVIEVISVEETGTVKYAASFYDGVSELHMYHKDFRTAETEMQPGVYAQFDEFDSYTEMLEHESTIAGIFQKGDVRDVLQRYKSGSFDLLLTDPPYRTISGGNKNADAPKGMLSKNDGKIFAFNDIGFDEWLPECYRLLKDGSHAYIFTNFLNLEALMKAVQNVGFKIHNLLIWKKNNATPNRWYMKNCEYVILARKGKAKAITDCGSMTVHEFPNIIGTKRHETEKPIELLKHYIMNSSREGDWVLDPFAGSGSTAEAALRTGRRFLTVEIDGKYAPIIHNRLLEAL